MKLRSPKLAVFLSLYLWALPLLFWGHLSLEAHQHDFSPVKNHTEVDSVDIPCELCDLYFENQLEAPITPILCCFSLPIDILYFQQLSDEKPHYFHFRNKGPPTHLFC